MVNGIDVSTDQGAIDWAQVHDAGYSWAVAKATEGVTYTDDSFATYYDGIKAAGMLRGAYHFLRLNDDPLEQANHFLSVYKPTSGDLPPMLDCEELPTPLPPAQAISAISKWLGVVEAATKRHCLLYMPYSYWEDGLDGTDGFAGHPLWIAHPGGAAIEPPVWPWTFWQRSWTGTVPGIIGDVDLDYYRNDLDALKALCLP